MKMILALAVLGQATFTAPPSPAPPAPPGSEIYQAELQRYENQLRRACLSEPGIRVLVQSWAASRAKFADRKPTWQQLEIDVATAAYADPVNMERLAIALRAKAAARSNDEMAQADDGIALLRQLSAKDRAIYARRFTWMQPVTPPPVC